MVGVLGQEGAAPLEGNQEVGRYGGAGQVNKQVIISNRA